MPHLPPGDDEIVHAGGLPREAWNPDATRPSITLAEEQVQRRTPAPLSTPHDTVLADLYGHNRSASQNNVINTASNIAAHDSVTPQLNNPYSDAFFSNLSPTSEPLLDPFTGAHIGDQFPDPAEDESKMEEELWTHLSKILKLQSVIAEKHVKMEGIGLKKPGVARGKSKGVPRRSSTNIGKRWLQGADEGADEEADEEAQRKRELEEDFAGLGDKFAGRKDAIDGIMKNVCPKAHHHLPYSPLVAGRTLRRSDEFPCLAHPYHKIPQRIWLGL